MALIAGFVGSFPIYVYGLLLLGGVLGAIFFSYLILKCFKEDFSPLLDIFLWGMPCAFLTSRLFYVLHNWNLYQNDPWSAFFFVEGGTSFYGAALGFGFVFYFVLKKRGLPIFRYADAMALPLIFLLMLLQIGHFSMQTTVGIPLENITNDHSLAEYIEYSYRPAGFEMYDYFMPVALYQAFLQFVLFFIILFFTYHQRQRRFFADGGLFLVSVIILALIRFSLGFYYLSLQGTFDVGQALSFVVAILASVAFYFNRQKAKKDISVRR